MKYGNVTSHTPLGTLVQLRSGSPTMVLESIDPQLGKAGWVAWINPIDGKSQAVVYALTSLTTLIDPDGGDWNLHPAGARPSSRPIMDGIVRDIAHDIDRQRRLKIHAVLEEKGCDAFKHPDRS